VANRTARNELRARRGPRPADPAGGAADAHRVIAEATTSVVSASWFDAVWAALEEPPVANPALRARAARPRRIAQR
jgi:hypothetical protein